MTHPAFQIGVVRDEESTRPYEFADPHTKFTNKLLVSILRQEQCYMSHHLSSAVLLYTPASFNSNNQVRKRSLRNTTRHPFKIHFHQRIFTFLLQSP